MEGILYTDLYQLTMAHLYYRQGLHLNMAQFDHFFRSYPDYGSHMAGYCINAGLEWLLDWMGRCRFGDEEIAYLRTMTGTAGRRLFEDDFLGWLKKEGTFEGISLQAIPEGRVVHPNVPLTVIEGPLAMAQILETALLNKLNYPTLIATRAARISQAGRGNVVLEFGMRRGQERGVNAGARAAMIGGAEFSSNTGLSQKLGIPARGTHAHSMVQVFMALGQGELEAFAAYAEVYPDNCLLLVDTINTLESGVPNAIRIFERLRRKGHRPIGIRLDSGDLAYLAVRSAELLNRAGFPETSIVLSNQLDEMTIVQILNQIQEEAPNYGLDADQVIERLAYGVGTRLITSDGDAALDGVYKLVALQHESRWRPAIKISENPIKTPNPGRKKGWRIYDRRGLATADLLALEEEDPPRTPALFLQHPTDHSLYRTLEREQITGVEPLLVPVLQEGRLVYDLPDLESIRRLRTADLDRLDAGVKRLIHPHIYHVSLSQNLWELKQALIAEHRQS